MSKDFDALRASMHAFNLLPPEIPPGTFWLKRWWMMRRYAKLSELMVRYHICPGPAFWSSTPRKIIKDIDYALKHARPFKFPDYDLPPDSPDTAALRQKLRACIDCADPEQCWEPCGELGKDDRFVKTAKDATDFTNPSEQP